MKHVNTRLVQHEQVPAKKIFDAKVHWIVIFAYPLDTSAREKIPYASTLIARRRRLLRKKADSEPINIDLPNKIGSQVAFACLEPAMDMFGFLTLARKLVAVHDKARAKQIGVVIDGFEGSAAERIAEAIIAAACTAAAEMPTYKSKKDKPVLLQRIELYGVKTRHGFKRSMAEAEGNAVTRYLSMLPANKLTPALYLRHVRTLARQYGWQLEFMDIKTLQRKKAGAFLAVAQGSPAGDAGIVRLQYKPQTARPQARLALVGKGICYDTGGTNLKPAGSMFGMHEDMQGSAVALGTLIALSTMKSAFTVDCYLALATNHIGPRAYKPNEVITAYDRTTIEIVHTDAEGRMVLADTLAMASRNKPDLLIDYATLTGACIYSLGTAYSGVFTNKEEFNQTLIAAGKDSGERVWPFPMDEDYDKALESEIADIKQCSLESGMDHILAARFLQRFVKNNRPWIHIDLAASNRKGGLAHVPTATTGFGVRYTLNLLLDQKIVSQGQR